MLCHSLQIFFQGEETKKVRKKWQDQFETINKVPEVI
jgi:hypothetical protein